MSACVAPCLTWLRRGGLAVIEYRLLGPLEVSVNGTVIRIGGLRQRTLLAMLLLRANQPVPRDVLADQLWGEHPPRGAQHTLDVYLSRLRKALDGAGDTLMLTRPGAYLLRAADEQVDARRFERLAAQGRQALAANAPAALGPAVQPARPGRRVGARRQLPVPSLLDPAHRPALGPVIAGITRSWASGPGWTGVL